ncbi:WD40-repeat-containing domain protein [Lentinula edodes]|uniref:WD40-repeat-containing domain protein n=1 Tax=Lentinula edodes TaxID=5353 RepID=UPI001E8DCD9E|nr:WD40-repeat-containing domain protein [Lentinula edodes]KAH7878358.1 WD40-repeat-containing domain protein [Lentinula edodes]
MVTDSQYQAIATLQGPRDAVVSLAFSVKAKFLSAAGYSGVYVWDLSTFTSAPLPHMLFAPQNPKYVIMASVWVYFQKNKRHILLLGSMRGDIILWDWNNETKSFQLLYRVPPMENKEDEILSMDVYEHDIASGRIGRVVASTANRCISVWTLTSSGEFSKIFSTVLDEGVNPKTVCMCKITRDIFVFPFYGGEIHCLDYKTGAVKHRKSHAPGIMGSVAMNSTTNKFVAYTGKSFQLYRLGSLELVKTFKTELPLVLFPKQVAFGELENIVVGGSDRGCALVYDVNSEEVLQKLSYPSGGLVQPVSASTISLPERHLIVVAGSTAQQPADVILFEKCIPAEYDSTTDIRNGRAPTQDAVLIGFYLPKRLWKWIRILGAVVVCVTFVGYYILPIVYQVCNSLDHFESLINFICRFLLISTMSIRNYTQMLTGKAVRRIN